MMILLINCCEGIRNPYSTTSYSLPYISSWFLIFLIVSMHGVAYSAEKKKAARDLLPGRAPGRPLNCSASCGSHLARRSKNFAYFDFCGLRTENLKTALRRQQCAVCCKAHNLRGSVAAPDTATHRWRTRKAEQKGQPCLTRWALAGR